MEDQLSILAQKLKEANESYEKAHIRWKESEDAMNQAYEDMEEASRQTSQARRSLIDFVEQKA